MKRKVSKIVLGMMMVFSLIGMMTTSYCLQNFETVEERTGIVTANLLNVRQSTSTNSSVIETIRQGERVNIFAQVEDWYIIQTNRGMVGCAKASYIEKQKEDEVKIDTSNITQTAQAEESILKLINEKRKENGLMELTIDPELQNTARLKANEMVEKDYFSHTSPEYGSPFDMMRYVGLTYKTAGENIAGNPDVNEAVKAWMNSEGHKNNILDTSYNYTGIGVANSPKYGMIYVQMFMGK